MGGIMITHCEKDRPLAEGLRSRLAELAVPDWCEFVSLTSTVSDGPVIAEMTAAGALVVLLSKYAKRDPRVMTEAGLAVSLGKPVIAVVVDNTKPESMDFLDAQVWIAGASAKSTDSLAREVYNALLGHIS